MLATLHTLFRGKGLAGSQLRVCWLNRRDLNRFPRITQQISLPLRQCSEHATHEVTMVTTFYSHLPQIKIPQLLVACGPTPSRSSLLVLSLPSAGSVGTAPMNGPCNVQTSHSLTNS